uniref:Putative ovule protein n=1 Tax=Solanum chacoense TaxID=4108 RepID=A0A0V0HPI2_SOLCH
MEGSEIKEEKEAGIGQKKKIFVAGATGNTGKRIVEQLLTKGFAVKAGVRDVDKAKSNLPEGNPLLQIVSTPLISFNFGFLFYYKLVDSKAEEF